MKWLFIFLGILVLLILIVLIIGWSLPVKHTASVSKEFSVSGKRIWNLITQFDQYKTWRTGLKELVVNDQSWTETDKHNQSMTFEVVVSEANQRFQSRITNDNLPFGGSWTYVLKEENGKTTLTITENGEIYNPVFRFVSKFLLGYTATMNAYMKDLENAVNK
ncbi:SRPBCC family protein [Fulvivirgaceae bacterium BMA10]|uniref:SRPBCC family protein n=1 Tax=Splendidivirga corallicola TaxID=3051826 RepID=A0ABT8KTS3_9BACT|nr:SRPBCC family protein [Fulvivirgaceae bacterium BMA10]